MGTVHKRETAHDLPPLTAAVAAVLVAAAVAVVAAAVAVVAAADVQTRPQR